MGMDIYGDVFPQDVERGGGGCTSLGGGCRTGGLHTAGKHRADRSQRRTPHPSSARQRVTATVHVTALRMRRQCRVALLWPTRRKAE